MKNKQQRASTSTHKVMDSGTPRPEIQPVEDVATHKTQSKTDSPKRKKNKSKNLKNQQRTKSKENSKDIATLK